MGLWDPLGNRVVSGRLNTDLETNPLGLGGNYLLMVEGYLPDTAPINFGFTVYNHSSPVVESLSVGATQNGSISIPGQQRVYEFSLNQVSMLMLDTLTLSSPSLFYRIDGPAGSTSLRNLADDNYNYATDTPYRLLPGNYRILVDGEGAAIGTYAFRLLDTAAAPNLPLNVPVTGTLGPNRQTDLYAFNGVAGTRLYLQSQSTQSLNSVWRLIGPSGQTMLVNNLNSSLGGYQILTTGRYILAVESYMYDQANIPYSLTVQTVDIEPANTTLAPAAVNENLPIGTPIGVLSTSDVNASSVRTYSLVSGPGDTDNALFSIVNNEFRTAAVLNFETKSVYSVRVRTVDNVGLLFDRIFTINVANTNDAPTAINLSNTTLVENLPANSVVGLVSGTDPDAGDTLIYTLPTGVGDNSFFELAGNALRARTTLDFETKSTYSITLRAIDSGGLSLDRTFTVSLINMPELAGPVQIGDGTIQRSAIRQLVVDFDADVVIDAGAFSVDKRTLVSNLPTFAAVNTIVDISTLPNGKTRATLTFTGH